MWQKLKRIKCLFSFLFFLWLLFVALISHTETGVACRVEQLVLWCPSQHIGSVKARWDSSATTSPQRALKTACCLGQASDCWFQLSVSVYQHGKCSYLTDPAGHPCASVCPQEAEQPPLPEVMIQTSPFFFLRCSTCPYDCLSSSYASSLQPQPHLRLCCLDWRYSCCSRRSDYNHTKLHKKKQAKQGRLVLVLISWEVEAGEDEKMRMQRVWRLRIKNGGMGSQEGKKANREKEREEWQEGRKLQKRGQRKRMGYRKRQWKKNLRRVIKGREESGMQERTERMMERMSEWEDAD